MLCSISGHVPETPVISVKSGLLFEKRLIEHEIAEHGVCPITKEPLTVEDLIDVRMEKNAKPRSSAASSIPGLLGIFHDEWDAVMLECHSLRQSLSTARQELSHALYQHDAACRVIARLTRERDAAKETLLRLQSSKRDLPEDEDVTMEEHPIKKMHMGITQEISDFIASMRADSAKRREEFEVSEETAKPDDVQRYGLLTSQPLHATKQGGIQSMRYHRGLRNLIVTAGEDCTIKIFDQSSRRILASIEEHFKKVNDVEWIGEELLASCSADKSLRVWMREDEGWEMKCGLHLKHHEEEVVAVTCAQNCRFLISASKDSTLGFTDLEQGKCLEKIASPLVDVAYSCVKFHPDGQLLASGTEAGDIHIWDMAQQKIIKTFSNEDGRIEGLSFHENGTHLATATAETVHLWDLRKMESFKVLKPYEDSSIRCVGFDESGRYFGIGGSDLRIYDAQQEMSPVTQFSEFPNRVRCVAFGEHASVIAAGSADHNLRLFGND